MTDREAANLAITKAMECLRHVGQLDHRVRELEEAQRQTVAILDEVLLLIAKRMAADIT